MRPFVVVLLAAVVLTACSTAPPRCCPSAGAPRTTPAMTLRERANGFQAVVDEKLKPRWEEGVLLSIEFTDESMTVVAGYDDADDAALYTGVYAAAQAFRYAAARTAEEKETALKSVREAARALHFLATVPGYPGGLARAASTNPSVIGCPQAQYCYSTGGVTWLGNTSRDQYTGWWFGNAVVYRLVDDPAIRATIRDDVGRMIRAIRDWKYRLHDRDGQPNSGTAGDVHHQMRITWHLIAASIFDDADPYRRWYHEQILPLELDEAWLEDAFEGTNVYYDYYGFNLGFLNAYNMVVLETDAKLRARYLGWMERELYAHVRNTGNALFDYMYMAASGTRLPDVLEADRRSLADFPGPPARWACVSPSPRPLSLTSRWLYLLNRLVSPKKISAHPQAATPYPISERCRHEFQWAESPYRVTCCCVCPAAAGNCPSATSAPAFCSGVPTMQCNVLVYTGADYLIAYWLGRYHGYLTAEE